MIRVSKSGNGTNDIGWIEPALYALQREATPTYEDEPDLCTAIEHLDPFQEYASL